MVTSPAPMASGPELPADWVPSAISEVPAYPGWLVPSIKTEVAIAGRGVTVRIVWTPPPGMSKSIAVAPAATSFASRIAWRSEPGPLSAFVSTLNTPSVMISVLSSGVAPADVAPMVSVAKKWAPTGG